MSAKKEILFVQYTNPAYYPPLERASRILADRGWDVLFLGIGTEGRDTLRMMSYPRIRIRLLREAAPGRAQKLHFFIFCIWVTAAALRRPGAWIYVSDPLSTPAGFVLSAFFGRRTIYHEHDTPVENPPSVFMRAIHACRSRAARRARGCVLPNAERARLFEQSTGARTITVWNCPLAEEAAPPKADAGGQELRVLYHGSIGESRLPLTLVEALRLLPAVPAVLSIFGYETIGNTGYAARFMAEARTKGVSDRVHFMGPAQHDEILEWARRSHVGLSFMPMVSGDVNMRHMTGASNKPFDNLACGLPLLVSDLEDWKQFYVEQGFGLACDPENPENIASALRWFYEHPDEAGVMGERGRKKILDEWNYENQFAKVLRVMDRDGGMGGGVDAH